MHWSWSVSVFLALSISGSKLDAQQVPTARLRGDHFVENLRAEAPVSGGDIVGIVIDNSATLKDARKLYVRRSAVDNPLVCIEAATIDGSYVAANTYTMPPAAAGTYVQIPIDSSRPLGTSYPDLFRSATMQTLAVMARIGACADQSVELLPVVWGGPPIAANTSLSLTVAVQSGRTSAFILVDESAESGRPCDSIMEGRRTAFDALCRLEVPSVKAGPIRLRLRRCAFDDCTNAPWVHLSL